MYGSVITILFITALMVAGFRGWGLANQKTVEASNYQLAYASTSAQLKDTKSELDHQNAELAAINAKYPTPTVGEIEAYMKLIFGPDFKVARAISHNECGPTHKDYPACEWHTSIEDSVGIFQINLYNSKQWIHAARIPGNTMPEKIEWLKNPFNNTLYAYWVFKTSGFNPWSTYSDGRYKNSL